MRLLYFRRRYPMPRGVNPALHSLRNLALAAFAALIAVAPAFAVAADGATRSVGPYRLTVGFRDEPAYTGQPNAVALRVAGDAGQPIEGVQRTLKVEIGTLGRTQVLDLLPVKGAPGSYEAVFIPPSGGRYTLRLFGAIATTQVDSLFVSGPGSFGDVTTRESNDYTSTGAYIAFGFLGAYLLGLALLHLYRRRRRPRTAAGARR